MVGPRFSSAALSFSFGLFVIGLSGASFAQSGSSEKPQVAVEKLTLSLLDLQDQHQKTAPAHKAQQLEKMLATAANRQNYLATVIETDPAQVLRLRLPKHHRASLPSAVQDLVEDEVTVEGDLEVIHEDRLDGSRYHHFLNDGRERLSLHFAGEPMTGKTGTRVRIKGVRVKQAVALAGGSGSAQTVAAALPNSLGVKNTLVLLVNFQDNTSQPYTTDYARNIVLTNTSNWDLENSYQQTSLTGDVYGWFTLPMSSTVCDYVTLANQAKSAATAAGINLSNYVRYLYAFPKNACGWWGLGYIGGTPSQSYVNGSLQVSVVGHEMGHNFGLYHSHALECGATTIGTSCTNIEYGDPLDIMGSSSGHLNAFQKERLGWLNAGASPPITTVLASGTYVLDPYETVGTNAKALKILQGTDAAGKKTWYYVEYRRAIGFDSFLSNNSNVLNGVVVHRGSETSSDSSFLLDMTPGTSSWSDPALTVGPTFTDAAAGVTISVAWVSSTGAAVNVSMGSSPPCVRANPTVTVTPTESQWVPAGTPVTYTLSLTNKDNAGCTTATFDLQASAPTGWSASFASTPLTAAPGATASATVTVTSPTGSADGFYTIGLSATNRAASTFKASSSVTYVVKNVSAPTITGQPQSQTVTAPATATFSVTASGTAPLSYQWQKNGATIAGATSASYTTPATSTADSGSSYRVVVSNSVNSVTSSAATLTVNAAAVAPTITSQPASTTVTAPASATFSVNATGTAPLSYQWQKNSLAIAGATSASYTTPATSTADSGSSYRVVVSNSVSSVTSNAATITVNAAGDLVPPGALTATPYLAYGYIYLKWTDTNTTESGYVIERSLNAAGGFVALAYTGTNAASYVDTAVTVGNTYYYQVRAYTNGGTITSAPATVSVIFSSGATIPTITSGPAGVSVTAPASATFSVSASGTAPLSYQWQKNSVAIPGATSASYTTPATTTADSGSAFRVVVSNSAGSATSGAATLTVNAGAVAPTITSQPTNMTVTAPASATFSVSASGTAPLSYQWQKNSVAIPGATSASYTTPATSTADSGSKYRVIVNNSAGSVTSIAGTLTVNGVVTTLDVSVATDGSTYLLSETVVVTTKATSGGTPVGGANVTVTMTNPMGKVTTKTAVTKPDGSVVVKFTPGRRGTFQIRSDVNIATVSGSATTSFSVQ